MSVIDEEQVISSLTELCTEHESKRQLADEQGIPFGEDLNMTLRKYVESLPSHLKEFALSHEEKYLT